MGRAPCCDKTKVKKGPWSPEEDDKLKSYIDKHGTGGNWIALPKKIGLKRCGKSCRLRWLNYLRPNIKHGGFSEDEDNIICSLYINIGSRWSIIAAQLPGRTDNDIKNYWNTRLKKKLLGKQRKEQQAHNRRAAATFKQQQAEIKRPNTTTNDFHHLPPNGFVNNQVSPYWESELPIMPMMSYQTHVDAQVLDHDQQVNLFYQNLGIDYMLSSSQEVNTNYGQLGQIGPRVTMFNGVDQQSDIEAELSELVFGSSHQSANQQHYDGLASFYQMEASKNGGSPGGTTSTSAADSEISWGDINSMVHSTTAQMVSDYENSCQQVVPLSDSAFHAVAYSFPFY